MSWIRNIDGIRIICKKCNKEMIPDATHNLKAVICKCIKCGDQAKVSLVE